MKKIEQMPDFEIAQSLKMYKVYNNVEDKIIFSGNEKEFIEFMNVIKNENQDVNYAIIRVSDAIKYVEDYCGNLETKTK
ncbi:MAG TPA: hypothetical protein VJ951_08015 [Bacteroidales bacterium]|nr:hypothetical protein [Bacteroidales bacterium]